VQPGAQASRANVNQKPGVQPDPSGVTLPPVNSPGDSFAWPFQDPGWFGKMIVQGLIYIIPIVGWIAIYGWLLMTIDNYRAGRRELAPAGFHLARGIALFVVYLVYAVIIEIPGGIVLGLAAGNHSSGLAAIGYAIDSLAALFILFLLPSIILSTYRSGFAGGFDVAAVWATATRDPGTTVIAAEKTGRHARVMEYDPGYCDVIVRRWQKYTGKAANLDHTDRTFEEIEIERSAVAQPSTEVSTSLGHKSGESLP